MRIQCGTIFTAAAALAAHGAEVVSFKDAAKIKSWDAWNDHKKETAPKTILEKEKPCVTMERLYGLKPGAGREIGRLKTRTSQEVKSSKWSVGCECLDRDYADWDAYKELLPMLGVKHARFISGWAKTEQEKGVYDFSWLDPQLRECAAMGVKPWVTLAYGNPVYGSDFRLGMRIKQLTGDKGSFAGWLRYVTAVVERYGDVVDEWEVWNEGYGQGEDYATLFIETGRAIRKVQPKAKIYCAAITQKDFPILLERLKSENSLDLASLFIYHPYTPNPDATYEEHEGDLWDWPIKPRPLRELVKKYSPDFDVYQGEVGCPAQLEFSHGLSNFEWTEYSQAKWNLRRAIGDAVRDIPSSVFTIIDYQYTFMLQSFGLIRSNALKEFVYRRPNWFAMSNVYAIFDDDTKPLGFKTEGKGRERLSFASFERFGKRLDMVWCSGNMPSSDLSFRRVDLSRHLPQLGSLVWVDMITGRAFELDSTRDVPVWDSPILICERDAVAIDAARPMPFKVNGRSFTWIPGTRPKVELKEIYPDDVTIGRNGTKWAEVTFSVEAPEDGDYEFGHINDYFGELHVNGVFVRETQGPGRSWKTISIPLKKGRNDVLFKTRSGAYGSWPVGFEIPKGLTLLEAE